MSGSSCRNSSQSVNLPTESRRSLTSYNDFVKKMFKEFHKKHPNDKAPDIMKRICAEWKIRNATSTVDKNITKL